MLEADIGLRSYLTTTPGLGGRLRQEPEDFRVIELGDVPHGEGHIGLRIQLRNWETNRFAQILSKRAKLSRGVVGFAGMKDKRAVTEQWFSVKANPTQLENVLQVLEELQDVELLEGPVGLRKQLHPGDHGGNRFELRARDGHQRSDALEVLRETQAQIESAGGVPNVFGPQRFGSAVRPITMPMGQALMAGDLDEAVRLYCGSPFQTEAPEVQAARQAYDDGNVEEALRLMPEKLDSERLMMQRILDRPDAPANALRALPHNLLQLFIHSVQSYLFNEIVSERLARGWGLRPRLGDIVQVDGERQRMTVVRSHNLAHLQAEYDLGRVHPTASLPGYVANWAEGEVGEMEQAVAARSGIDLDSFRCHAWPSIKSAGERRQIRMPVRHFETRLEGEDPIVGFDLGKGAYATIVMREFLKNPDLGAY